MPERRKIEYEILPDTVDTGEKWMTLRIKNKDDTALRNLNVRVNSMDTLGLEVADDSNYVPILAPDEEMKLYYKMNVLLTTPVYVSMDGYRGDEAFYWESPAVFIRVSTDPAEITSVFAMTQPHILVGDTIKTEASVRARQPTGNLRLEVWAEAPDGMVDELDTANIEKLDSDEKEIYTTELSPAMQGIYTIHAELFEGLRRLDHKVDYVAVEEA